MAEIALRTYLQQIDHAIEEKQFDEAVAHCKHILTHYPKNLDTYRLLGKALLEKGRHGDAADIFQRVLSAAPDDFVSHVGMAIVREDEANLEAALWHMERAFESNPANPAVQEELRRLYGRRDGVVPPRARLTRGALARLYTRGELYTQAEAELRAALADDPERLDLAAQLAYVLAEMGRRAEAADLCGTVLQTLPYNLEANRVLAKVLKAQNRTEEARLYQQRLEALDPYERFADGSAAHVKDEAVRVPEVDYDPDRQAAQGPEWAEALGEQVESPFIMPEGATEEPEWLRTGTGLLSQTAPLTGDLPEAGEVPDWMKDVEPVESTSSADLPDWMKATTGVLANWPATDDQPRRKTGGTSALETQSALNLPDDEMPDWMKDIASPTQREEVPTQELPSWLQASTGPIEADQPTARLEDELPDWMRTAQIGATVDEASTQKLDVTAPLGDETPEIPEWLKAVQSETSTVPLSEAPDWLKEGAAPPTDDLPDWLNTGTLGGSTTPSEGGEEDLPEWLKAVGGTAALEAALGPGETTQAAGDIPEWLRADPLAAEPPAEAASPAVELPDFLQPASPEAIARAQQPVEWEETEEAAPEPIAQPDEGGIPDWVKAMAPDIKAAPPAPALDAELPPVAAEELPDWLKAAAPSAPEATPAAEPDLATMDADEAMRWLESLAAKQGASPDELITQPTERLESPPAWLASDVPSTGELSERTPAPPEEPSLRPADIPALEPTEPGASETIMNWLSDKEVPDWLRAERAQARVEEPPTAPQGEPAIPDWLQPAQPPAPAEPTPATFDLGSMSDEEAMRWLEGLAARQGASEEELITRPEERLTTPAPEITPDEAPIEPASPDEMPEWLQAMRAAEPEAPHVAPEAEIELPAEAEAVPDLSTMDADEAMRWLESLAAKQGASPEELITQPAERPESPPAWVQAEVPPPPPAAAEPERQGPLLPPTGTLPDIFGINQPAETESAPAPHVEPVAEQPPAAAEPQMEAMPDLASMDADEAMRWLEGLAARQGASEEELITRPEERLEAPPTWISDEKREGPVLPATGILPEDFAVTPPEAPVEEAPPLRELAPEERITAVPSWIAGYEPEPVAEEPEMPKPAEPPVAEPPAPEAVAVPPEREEAEAMRWLESFAAREGEDMARLMAEATTPEEEPVAEPVSGLPDWVKAEPPAPPPAEVKPAEEELPAWIKAATPASATEPLVPPPPPEPAQPPVEPRPAPARPVESGDERLARLAERLAAGRRVKEEEVAARLERERAEREQAMREVEQRMTERRTRQSETGQMRPGTGKLTQPPEPETEKKEVEKEPEAPRAPIFVAEPQPEPVTVPRTARLPAARATRLARSRKGRMRKSVFAGQSLDEVLAASRQQLTEGNYVGAASGLEYLVSSGQMLDEVIVELEGVTATRPGHPLIHRLLGDAYMRRGLLQKALDAYRQALTRL